MVPIQHILMEEGFRTSLRLTLPTNTATLESLVAIAHRGVGPLPDPEFAGWWITVDYPRDAAARIVSGGAGFRLHYGRGGSREPMLLGILAWSNTIAVSLWAAAKRLFEAGREAGQVEPPLTALPLPLDLLLPLETPWLATIVSSCVRGMTYGRLLALPPIIHGLAAVLLAEAPELAGKSFPAARPFAVPLL